VGQVAYMGYMRNIYTVSVRKPQGKRSLGRSNQRWEDNIRIDPREIELEGVEWIHLNQDRDQWQAFVNKGMTFSFHKRQEIS